MDEHHWVPVGYRYRLGARLGQSIVHPPLAYAHWFPADGSQYVDVDGDTEQHELLQTPKSHFVQLCLGIFSPYHRFPESHLGSEMGPITWLTAGPTNPCGSVLVHKGPAFLHIHCLIPRRLYEHFFLNTTSTQLRKHWAWDQNFLQDLASSFFFWRYFFSRVSRRKYRNEANCKEWYRKSVRRVMHPDIMWILNCLLLCVTAVWHYL